MLYNILLVKTTTPWVAAVRAQRQPFGIDMIDDCMQQSTWCVLQAGHYSRIYKENAENYKDRLFLSRLNTRTDFSFQDWIQKGQTFPFKIEPANINKQNFSLFLYLITFVTPTPVQGSLFTPLNFLVLLFPLLFVVVVFWKRVKLLNARNVIFSILCNSTSFPSKFFPFTFEDLFDFEH